MKPRTVCPIWIERAERGERIVITRHGQPNVEFTPGRTQLLKEDLAALFKEVRRAKAHLPPYSRKAVRRDIQDGLKSVTSVSLDVERWSR